MNCNAFTKVPESDRSGSLAFRSFKTHREDSTNDAGRNPLICRMRSESLTIERDPLFRKRMSLKMLH